jgi:hypothetical protein
LVDFEANCRQRPSPRSIQFVIVSACEALLGWASLGTVTHGRPAARLLTSQYENRMCVESAAFH